MIMSQRIMALSMKAIIIFIENGVISIKSIKNKRMGLAQQGKLNKEIRNNCMKPSFAAGFHKVEGIVMLLLSFL